MQHYSRTSAVPCQWGKVKGFFMGMAIACRLQLGMSEAGFCVTVKFCRTFKAGSGLRLGQRIAAQRSAGRCGWTSGLALNSRFWVHLSHQTKECPCCPADTPPALCKPSSSQRALLKPEFGEGQWRYRRGEVQLMLQYIWPKLSFLQVAWLRHGCSLVCTLVWAGPPKRSWAQLLSAISRLWAQAAATHLNCFVSHSWHGDVEIALDYILKLFRPDPHPSEANEKFAKDWNGL